MPEIKKLSTTAVISFHSVCSYSFPADCLRRPAPDPTFQRFSHPGTILPQMPTWKFVYFTNNRFKTCSMLSKSARDIQKLKSFSSLCNLTPLHDVCVISTQFSFPAPVTLLGFSLSPPHPCSPKLEPWFVVSLPLQKGEEGSALDISADLRCVANIGTSRSQ